MLNEVTFIVVACVLTFLFLMIAVATLFRKAGPHERR